jgi:hypothetical protein
VRYHPPPGVSLGLSLFKSLLIGVSLTLALGLGVSVTDRADQRSAPSTGFESARVNRFMERYDCSATGFGPEIIPRSSLVHVNGRMKRVSFDKGWAVFTGDEPGTLMAVCLK